MDKKRFMEYNKIDFLSETGDRGGGGFFGAGYSRCNRIVQGEARGMQAQKKEAKRRIWPMIPVFCVVLLAFVVFAYAGVYRKKAVDMAHPVAYEEYVEKWAGEFGLEEAHVYAVILCESSFRPQAVSGAGARGLMQIMPETGAWLAGKFGEAGEFTEEKLFDPETSIRYGCWYLGYLKNRFGADLNTISAAYHAGQGNVDKWLAEPQYSADGATIDITPFDATNSYMKKVHAAYEVYVEKLVEN